MMNQLLMLAQNAAPSPFGQGGQLSEEEAAGIAALIFGGIGCAVLCVVMAILVVVVILLIKPLKKIPQQYRQIEPGLVWLLLIPVFNVVWNFFVYIRISKSFQAYFADKGRTDLGDCGQGIGLAFAICAACNAVASLLPIAGCAVSIASLVLLIIYLIKIHELGNIVAQTEGGAPPAASPPAAV